MTNIAEEWKRTSSMRGGGGGGGEKSWVVDIQSKSRHVDPASEAKLWTNHSIYPVPACIKDLNSKVYSPQVVSFGPYHHGEEHLLPMEQHKQRALLHFLARARRPLHDFVRALEEVLPQLAGAYARLDDASWKGADGEDRFLQLMMVDGCFMLEILRFAVGKVGDYAANDPIFSNHGMLYTVPYIKRDMLMVENQIPLLVLAKLAAVELAAANSSEVDEEYRDVNKLVLRFCNPNERPPNMELGLHALDVFRKSIIRGPLKKSPRFGGGGGSSSGGDGGAGDEIVRSAMELNEAGIRFKRSKTTSLRDISFKHGVLRLPVIVVDDATESMFLNLMAFERLHVNAGNEVTSYVFFMDNIIDSAKDVSLLHSHKIIQNALGSDKAVAKLFNSLSKDVTLDPDSSLDEVHQKVNSYCRKRWNTWRANLIHTYFRSPWALMSLAAAIFLLALTVGQTVYTVMPYYKPANSGGDTSVAASISPTTTPSPP